MRHNPGGDAHAFGPRDSIRLQATRHDSDNLGATAASLARLDDRLHVRPLSGDQNNEARPRIRGVWHGNRLYMWCEIVNCHS